jgi:hypothetical protein
MHAFLEKHRRSYNREERGTKYHCRPWNLETNWDRHICICLEVLSCLIGQNRKSQIGINSLRVIFNFFHAIINRKCKLNFCGHFILSNTVDFVPNFF